MDKEEIREKISEKRKQLSKQEVIDYGENVKEKLFSLEEYKKAKTVMFFVSFGREVYTHNMIKEALKDKRIVVPKIIDFEIVPCEIKDFRELVEGKYRILEPACASKEECEKVPKIDVALVPGMAFDKRGYRVGYGKGFYDNVLKDLGALKIGLCMDFQIIDNVPNDEWDIKMDKVITDKRII